VASNGDGDGDDARRELKQLQDTVAALRNELEESVAAREEAVVSACADRDAEIRQLHKTVETLRTELEKLSATPKSESPELKAAHDLARHLEATVQKMRSQLEAVWDEKAQAEEELRQEFEAERRLLQDTVAALRDELEGRHGHA
jgi:chromosome segregation ATPase